MKKGFTLAEVLITLGIIGIVAALTMPNLINNYQKHITIVKLKKAYSLLSQVVEHAVADYGEIKNWDKQYNGKDTDPENYFNKYWKPYVKITKSCVDRYMQNKVKYKSFGYKEPFPIYGGAWLSLNGSTTSNTLVIYTGLDFLTIDNMLIHVGEDDNIIVDINGPAGPNRAGRDAFWFSIDKAKNKIIPLALYYSEEECGVKSQAGVGGGYTCADKIIKDGWKIKEDYPW